MKINNLSESAEGGVKALMQRVPFYKELIKQDPIQLQALMAHSCLVELEPGETIMRRGDRGTWLYVLIKGRLAVYADELAQGEPLNVITPGELFGDLALLCDYQRKATVIADRRESEITLFATDFKIFGGLTDFSLINLNTKLMFYRTMVYSIRWRLEQNRIDNPAHPLVQELKRVPIFKGDKGSIEELQSLFEQAQFLASLLDRWNSQSNTLQDVVVATQSY